jgi:hypothetical protein
VITNYTIRLRVNLMKDKCKPGAFNPHLLPSASQSLFSLCGPSHSSSRRSKKPHDRAGLRAALSAPRAREGRLALGVVNAPGAERVFRFLFFFRIRIFFSCHRSLLSLALQYFLAAGGRAAGTVPPRLKSRQELRVLPDSAAADSLP